MSVVNVWSGGVTSSGAQVVAKVTGTSCRLAVADNEALSSPTFFGPVTPTAQHIASFSVTGLAPNTRHWYAVEDDGQIDTSNVGRFQTHATVGSPFSFTFAASACAGSQPRFPGTVGIAPDRVSDHPAWDAIRDMDPLLFIHMGDFAYYDFGSGAHVPNPVTVDAYRDMYDAVLATRQGTLYRNVPINYNWDDHDYGPNDTDGTNPNKALAAQVYRERVPHYPLAQSTGPIYHTFQIGRVLLVVTDLRYERAANTSPSPRDMISSTQLAWFETTVSSASSAEVLVWVSSQPTIGGSNISWGAYTEQRATIFEMLGDHGWIGRMLEIAGDQHQIGIDSGAHNFGVPLYTFAPIDSGSGGVTSPYDVGRRADRGQFGTVKIEDPGAFIRVTGSGWHVDA